MTSTEHIQLSKHHGLGNDFLIAVEPAVELAGVDAVTLCDRRTGIGADGLIISTKLADDVWSMTLFNADGSRAEISGNGIRCLGHALARHTGVDVGVGLDETFVVRTDGGLRTLKLSDDRRSKTIQVKVDMGPVSDGPKLFDGWSELGIETKRQAGVAIGNPHLVVEVEEPAAIDLAKIGPAVEAEYAEGVNVHFAAITDTDTVVLHPWERGAGITQACGSGASVSAYQFHAWGLVGPSVEVIMPGGSVRVDIEETVFLTGPATFIAKIEISR